MKTYLLVVLLSFPFASWAQFAIGSRTITYTDASRNNRAISCEVYYPAVSTGSNTDVEVGQFPVIIFGHGFVMQPGAYPNWKDEFVPEGYIMVFPSTETSASPNHQNFGLDLQFLATEMQNEGTNTSSPFYQHIANRNAIMGHSMGGGATVLGASGFAGIDCIVGLAPAETNPSAVTAAADVSAPALILSGSSDGVTPPADHHIPIYDGLGSNCKYFVNIQNGSHCYFASNPGLCSFGEFIPGSLPAASQRNVSYAVCRPWFEFFLKDNCDAWDDFQTALATESALGTVNSICSNNAPIISDNNGTLNSDVQPNYQWFLNGNEIPNADQQSYTYTQSGIYQVGATILGTCPTLSNEIVVQATGVVEREIYLSNWGNQIEIISRDQLDKITLEWFDLSGKLIAHESINSVSANQTISIVKPNYVGVKLLRLSSNQATKAWKLL